MSYSKLPARDLALAEYLCLQYMATYYDNWTRGYFITQLLFADNPHTIIEEWFAKTRRRFATFACHLTFSEAHEGPERDHTGLGWLQGTDAERNRQQCVELATTTIPNWLSEIPADTSRFTSGRCGPTESESGKRI